MNKIRGGHSVPAVADERLPKMHVDESNHIAELLTRIYSWSRQAFETT